MSIKLFSRVAGAALLVVTMMSVGIGDAFAQRGAPADADRMITRLQSQLELSDAQVQQLRPLLQAHAQQRSDMMNRAREAGTPLRDNAEFMQMRQQHREQVEAILTSEQVAKYRTMQRQFENRRAGPGERGAMMRGPGNAGPNLDRMTQRLNLTEEQQAQIREVMAQQVTRRDAMRTVFQNQIGEILTDEQRAEWQSMRADRPNRGERRMAPRRGNR
jgi:Spy/CpxP family protein refolding chaperone